MLIEECDFTVPTVYLFPPIGTRFLALGILDMPVTMDDVAKAAGVALSTVSRALANNPRVNVTTRENIQKLAREMGYVPSAIARGLATKRTFSLGIVVRDVVDPFPAELVRLIDTHALELGYSLILSHSGNDERRELAAINILRQQRVDAIIMPDSSVSDSFLARITDESIPVVLLNRMNYRYSIGIDNVGSGEMAVNHLLGLGHRRIAYVGGLRCKAESDDRQKGYERALQKQGLSVDRSLIALGDSWPEGGQICMRQFLKLEQLPTAVFCFNDLTAFGAIGAIQSAGLRVPQDISVMGFDDITLSSFLNPPLTSIAQDKEQLAKLAVDMAHALATGKPVPERTILPGRLVVRASTTLLHK
jgi:DNA-binding LacI/PurR family transcriptional regulator